MSQLEQTEKNSNIDNVLLDKGAIVKGEEFFHLWELIGPNPINWVLARKVLEFRGFDIVAYHKQGNKYLIYCQERSS